MILYLIYTCLVIHLFKSKKIQLSSSYVKIDESVSDIKIDRSFDSMEIHTLL